MEQVVICSYRPKPGKKEELLSVLEDHVPTLRMAGFASGHPRSISMAADGTVIEIFAWENEEAARKAHDHPEVQEIWQKIGALADLVPLSALPETQKPFAHFKLAPNPRAMRPAHFHILADDPERCAGFYRQVFDWEIHQWGEMPFWFCDTGREPSPGIDGGIIPREGIPGGGANIIFVQSLDEQIQKVEKAGGKIVQPKMHIEGVGWQAFAVDTEGNAFGMLQTER